MPSERLPWVIRQRRKDGSFRWYWQRRGHKTVRLPDDPVERLRRVRDLNAAADGKAHLAPGSIAWCADQYRSSDAFADLRGGSVRVYKRWLDWFEAEFGTYSAATFDRQVVMRLKSKLSQRHGPATVLQAFAVLRLILEVARDNGYTEVNHARMARLRSPKPRQAVWTDAQIHDVLAVAKPHVALAFKLLLYTAQRPSDVIRMAWTHYNGTTIQVRQQKTDVLLEVPVHRDLKTDLDVERRRGPLIAVRRGGRAWTVGGLRGAVLAVMKTAKVDTSLQLRDLRRSAVVRLAEAGCTVPEIAAITGHSLKNAESILRVYLPRTTETARSAVLKWERKVPESLRPQTKNVE